MSHQPAARAVLEAMRPRPQNTNIRWDCRAEGCYRDALPDWTPLNDCFPRAGIRVSDIDGMVEVGGHFLFFEWKPPRVTVPEGQLRALIRLSRLPAVTVVILWGQTTSEPVSWQIISNGEAAEETPVTFDEWHDFTAAWAAAANDQPATSSHLVPPRPKPSGRTAENLVPNPRPGPFRDEGDEGRGAPQTNPPTTTPGTNPGTNPTAEGEAA